ncbi:MAG: fumarate hydratase C-terminal domain-containing protein [Spirochaetales bacterium]|nr:fumarate hydratase C-terminal domain-containing protein [Spirochaetales bacterium]
MVWTTIRLFIPIQEDEIDTLQAGDRLLVNGRVFSMRDKALQRISHAIEKGDKLPFDFRNGFFYYAGPTPALEGEAKHRQNHSIDPEISRIMESLQIRGMIGQGPRSQLIKDSCRNFKSLYLEAFFGQGSHLNHYICSKEIAAFGELGADAVFELKITDLPLIIINDIYGRDLYEIAKKEDSKAIQEILQVLSINNSYSTD